MQLLVPVVFLMSTPVFATGSGDLVGVWKLVSWQVIVDSEPPQDVFGLHPKGYLIFDSRGAGDGIDDRRGAQSWNG